MILYSTSLIKKIASLRTQAFISLERPKALSFLYGGLIQTCDSYGAPSILRCIDSWSYILGFISVLNIIIFDK